MRRDVKFVGGTKENREELERLFHESLAELASLGIIPRKITQLKVNTRLFSTLGYAKKSKDFCTIDISQAILEEKEYDDKMKKNILIHEILHCCNGTNGHTGRWQRLANLVNSELGYNINAFAEREEYVHIAKGQRYAVRCKKCGEVFERRVRSAVITHPERYKCGKCGGRLEEVKK